MGEDFVGPLYCTDRGCCRGRSTSGRGASPVLPGAPGGVRQFYDNLCGN
jgi:hypothetical protein